MTHRSALLLAGALAFAPFAAQGEPAVTIPPLAAEQPAQNTGLETAVLAGGCFWGIQAVYQHVKGVTNAVSGYAGGAQKDALYETVSSGRTGHAESVKVTFDPRQVSYGKILQVYFSVAHDPTQLNRQGPDSGTQYRSEIFPQSEAQLKAAKDYIAQLDTAHAFKRPIVTKTELDEVAVLCGRGLPPGLRDSSSLPALHRHQRRTEGREPEEAVSGALARPASNRGAGRRRRWLRQRKQINVKRRALGPPFFKAPDAPAINCRGSSAICVTGSGASTSAAPSPRSAGCARG